MQLMQKKLYVEIVSSLYNGQISADRTVLNEYGSDIFGHSVDLMIGFACILVLLQV